MSDSNENTQPVGETVTISNAPETSQNKKIAQTADREQGLTARQHNAAELLSLGHSCSEIAEIVGCSPGNARYQMNKPGTEWNIGQLMKYCDALGIPYEEALKAAIQ